MPRLATSISWICSGNKWRNHSRPGSKGTDSASFAEVHDPTSRVCGVIPYGNRNVTKPLAWTYQGEPLVVKTAEPCGAALAPERTVWRLADDVRSLSPNRPDCPLGTQSV
jgi:hypothetical protein